MAAPFASIEEVILGPDTHLRLAQVAVAKATAKSMIPVAVVWARIDPTRCGLAGMPNKHSARN